MMMPLSQTLGPVSFKQLNELHKYAHPTQAKNGVYHPEWNKSGCTQAWCQDQLPELLPTYTRIRKDLNPNRKVIPAFLLGMAWSWWFLIGVMLDIPWWIRSPISIAVIAISLNTIMFGKR